MFDVSKLADSESVAELTIPMKFFNPVDGKDTGSVWHIRSHSSEEYKSRVRKRQLEVMKKVAAQRNAEFEPTEDDLASQDLSTAEFSAALVAGWESMVDGGKPIKCSYEEVLKLTSNPMVGDNIIKQIDKKAGDIEGFFKASQKTSETQSSTGSNG